MSVHQPVAEPGARLELGGVRKTFGAAVAVDDANLSVAAGSFTALLGPSGCGKSTLLGLIAGLLEPDAGLIALDGQPLPGVPAERRPVGLVFQKPLLFPQLTVEANVMFGLRMHRYPRDAARAAARTMLERVQLTAVASRRVDELSGGQEQRVALARALVLSPRLLLLDEPFSQLDASLRAEMRCLVKELAAESKVTTVFVTHDQAEAVEMADDIALMFDGRIARHGSAELFFLRPPSLQAARFFGVTNELAGEVRAGVYRAAVPGADFTVPTAEPDGPAVLVVRPEAVQLDRGSAVSRDPSALHLAGIAVAARFAGTHLAVEVDLGGGRKIQLHTPLGTSVQLGADIGLNLPPAACTVFAADRR